jgi:hypothetical protein
MFSGYVGLMVAPFPASMLISDMPFDLQTNDRYCHDVDRLETKIRIEVANLAAFIGKPTLKNHPMNRDMAVALRISARLGTGTTS